MESTMTRPPARLAVEWAQSEDDVLAAQQLRYEIFCREWNAQLASGVPGIDRDRFDPFCEHLIVRDRARDIVVGTYRILESSRTALTGGFYSHGEFDLSRLAGILSRTVEVGRSCVHPDYRSGGVLALLWSGLTQYVRTSGHDFIIGCASIPLNDGAQAAAAACRLLMEQHLTPDDWRVFPRQPFPMYGIPASREADVPPLIWGYLRAGAYVCGDPAWDKAFNTADLLMLLPVAGIHPRYARHFFDQRTPLAPAA